MSAARRRPGSRRVTAAFGVTALAAVSFGVIYVLGGDVRLEGIALFVAFAGLAYGFGAWAYLQLPQGPYVEEREAMRSGPGIRMALASELERDDAPLRAATMPRRALVLAVGTLLAVLLFPLRSLFRGPRPGDALASTPWQDGTMVVLKDGTPVRPDDLEIGTMVTVFPRGHTDRGDVAVALIRAEAAELTLPADRRAWTVDGLVAYSQICTHAGCPVGQYVATTGRLMCPCHQSLFDAWAGAVPVAGPAARPLPQLPLGVSSDGVLVARGELSAPVGPGYWRQT